MITYSFEIGKHGEIIFQTNSEELKEDISKYIANCVDAISWRKRVESVAYVYPEEGSDSE